MEKVAGAGIATEGLYSETFNISPPGCGHTMASGRALYHGKKTFWSQPASLLLEELIWCRAVWTLKSAQMKELFSVRGAILRRRQNHENEHKNQEQDLRGMLAKKRWWRHFQIWIMSKYVTAKKILEKSKWSFAVTVLALWEPLGFT